MYQPPVPSAATAVTCPTTLGKAPTALPLIASRGTPAPVTGPTDEKLPPM